MEREERKERMSDTEYRQTLVMKGLVVKKVIEEKDGQLTLGDSDEGGDLDDQSAGEASRSIDSTDENVSTCVICLEAFRVGDVVAWSRTLLEDPEAETCNHVFHKECIVGWLMEPTHDDCPSCRTLIVHEEECEDDVGDGNEASSERSDPSSTSVFVIMHGLVSRARRASYSLIGQSINVRDDAYQKIPPPKVPPSPMRRVFSLEESSQRPRSSSLRQRSSGSISARSSSLTIPNATAEKESIATTASPHPSPPVLRRVVSDLTRTPPLPLTRESSFGRRFPNPFRPRAQPYQLVTPFDHESEHSLSERSLSVHSVSEHSFDDEEAVAVHHIPSEETIEE